MNDRNSTPTVSIGMPVYNGAKYIEAALDSLLAQSFTDFELIISDNASTDQTESICRSYSNRDSRIRYFRESGNRGSAWNFNRVYELSRGRFFKWAAADDVCAPTYIERCIEVLERDPSVVCCHARTQKIDGQGHALKNLPDPTMETSWLFNRPMDGSARHTARRFLDVLLTTGWGARCYGLIRSESLRNTQLILPTFGSEKVLMAEISLKGRFHDLPETLWMQRVHQEASSILPTNGARSQFITGQSSTAGKAPRAELLRGHIHSVMTQELSALTRILCLLAIVRYLLQINKWARVLKLSRSPASIRAAEQVQT